MNQNQLHTPGPWHVGGADKATIYDHLNQRLANSFERVMVTQRTDAQCQANARLISAAPELLDVVERAVRRLEIAHANGDSIMREWIVDARAAIAKATGANHE